MEVTTFCCNILKTPEVKNQILMEDGTDSKNLEGCEGLDPSEEAGIKDEGC